MTDIQDTKDNARFLSPGEVSVNTRGTRSDDLSKKLIFTAVIIGMAIVIGIYVFNEWREANRRSQKEKSEKIILSDHRSIQTSKKRVFEALKPVSIETTPATCKDILLLDKSGNPVLDKDGQAIKITCDGKIVPEIDFKHPPPNISPSSTPNNRYAGDIFIESRHDNLPQDQVTSRTADNPSNDELEVKPSKLSRVTANKIGDRNLLLTKGSHIDCALTTKVISDISGFASCILTNHIYSDNGKTLLLERGSDVQGEYTATLSQGQRRLFVLWTRIKTPHGIVINLDSNAADGLGAMGLDGYVDNHWWERLGAAFLLSFIKDAVAYQIAKDSATGGTLVYQNSAQTSNQMADRVLSNTINIKPTLYKNQGDRASIYVARDLDFSTVYALRAE